MESGLQTILERLSMNVLSQARNWVSLFAEHDQARVPEETWRLASGWESLGGPHKAICKGGFDWMRRSTWKYIKWCIIAMAHSFGKPILDAKGTRFVSVSFMLSRVWSEVLILLFSTFQIRMYTICQKVCECRVRWLNTWLTALERHIV